MRLVVLVGLVGCGSIDLRESVSADGEQLVGHRRGSFTYTAVGDAGEREIPVEIWYPAVDGGEPAAEYGVAGVVEIADEDVLASAAVEDGEFGVVVYSHGSGGLGALGYPYARRLASHGWVVVAPDHIGNTSNDLLTGGSGLLRAALDRPIDVSELLDALEAGTLDPDLAGRVEVDRTLVLGHSFGGYTSLRSPGNGVVLAGLGCDGDAAPADCALLAQPGVTAAFESPAADPRVKAIVPQAPAFAQAFDPDDLGANVTPMLLMSGARDRTTPDFTEAAVFWNLTTGTDDRWLHLPEGGHYSFISVCDDVPEAFLDLLGAGADGCDDTFTPVRELLPGLAAYTLAFAEWHVNGDEDYAALFEADAASLSAGMLLEAREP